MAGWLEQVTCLRERVERLQGQVTDWASDYPRLAVGYRNIASGSSGLPKR